MSSSAWPRPPRTSSPHPRSNLFPTADTQKGRVTDSSLLLFSGHAPEVHNYSIRRLRRGIEWGMSSTSSPAKESRAELQSKRSPAVGAPVVLFLRLEGLALAATSAVLYAHSGASWWLFAGLWLVPDLSMLGYLVSSLGSALLQRHPHHNHTNHIGPDGLVVPRSRSIALCAHLAEPYRRGPVAGLWTQVSCRLWLDASRQARKTARRIYPFAFVSCLTPGVSARTTSEAPSAISSALTIDM